MRDINWNTDFFNFGFVGEDSTVEFSFIYYSGKILTAIGSCGCSTTKVKNNELKTTVKVGKVIIGDSKQKNVNIEVATDDGKNHVLYLKQ